MRRKEETRLWYWHRNKKMYNHSTTRTGWQCDTLTCPWVGDLNRECWSWGWGLINWMMRWTGPRVRGRDPVEHVRDCMHFAPGKTCSCRGVQGVSVWVEYVWRLQVIIIAFLKLIHSTWAGSAEVRTKYDINIRACNMLEFGSIFQTPREILRYHDTQRVFVDASEVVL